MVTTVKEVISQSMQHGITHFVWYEKASIKDCKAEEWEIGTEKVDEQGRNCKVHCMEFYDKTDSCLIIILNMLLHRITDIILCDKIAEKIK
jgi:hypothetical protein